MKATIRNRARGRLDKKFEALRPLDRFAMPPKGWIRAIRDAIGMTGAQLGKRVGNSPQGIVGLERSEAAGTIQLNTLRRAAEAMECVLVYAIVPKTSLADMVNRRAREIAQRALQRVSHSMALEDQQVDRDMELRIQTYIETALRDRDLWEAQ
ncbi:mobile mystery protein A [Sphingobium subterraneum]|uniref:Putative DNA-binding mobile mystery protein A n=1 Tax=Sphingobium subterraneum TaxID=627688 RepID=A0A841J3M7_9SPHN|nr:mobile mystery protein A [Sphingobium subterraneum]MBB6125417.1 putative DNA-binding mobile mystery protein A [Sphingobium subterraneum]